MWFALGRRTGEGALIFTDKLAYAMRGNFQVTTDGFSPYRDAIVASLGTHKIGFAQLVKLHTTSPEKEIRYSPAVCTGAKKTPIFGNPDMEKVSTSHVERQNLTVRMSMRRMTCLTNAFSKKWLNLKYAYALQFAFYNFCRVHQALRVTPAMEASLTNHIWNISELLDA
jgi:hypothetical protein